MADDETEFNRGYDTAINHVLSDITKQIPGGCSDEETDKFDELRKSMELSWEEFIRKVMFSWSVERLRMGEE